MSESLGEKIRQVKAHIVAEDLASAYTEFSKLSKDDLTKPDVVEAASFQELTELVVVGEQLVERLQSMNDFHRSTEVETIVGKIAKREEIRLAPAPVAKIQEKKPWMDWLIGSVVLIAIGMFWILMNYALEHLHSGNSESGALNIFWAAILFVGLAVTAFVKWEGSKTSEAPGWPVNTVVLDERYSKSTGNSPDGKFAGRDVYMRKWNHTKRVGDVGSSDLYSVKHYFERPIFTIVMPCATSACLTVIKATHSEDLTVRRYKKIQIEDSLPGLRAGTRIESPDEKNSKSILQDKSVAERIQRIIVEGGMEQLEIRDGIIKTASMTSLEDVMAMENTREILRAMVKIADYLEREYAQS